MKNIAQYFEDTLESSNNTNTNDDTKEEAECKKDTKGKRSRVKIRISRTTVKERVCDIVESSSDMIDKTPSPFGKVNKKDKNQHETPKKSSLSKLSPPAKHKKLTDRHLSYLALERNDLNDKKKQSKENDLETRLSNGKKYKKESSDKGNVKKDPRVNGMLKNKEVINKAELITIDSDIEIENNREESNAFHILMNRNKSVQCISPTKLSPQSEEEKSKKLEESKEKLKRNKEKLMALADKKGYSKRKLAEVEKGERIEQTIQSRMKLLKGDERKNSSSPDASVLNRKQPAGSLLNYFSKTPVDLTNSSMTNVTTIVVKADVHVTDTAHKHGSCKSGSIKKLQPVKKNKRSNVELSQVDDIIIVESENINISANTKKQQQDEEQQNKRRWSLRIKLHTYENENATEDPSSDEELYSPRSRKFGVLKSTDSENLPAKSKNKNATLKRTGEHGKLKLKRREQSENSAAMQDDEKYLKKGAELIKSDKRLSASTKDNKKLNGSKNLENIVNDKETSEDCVIVNDNNPKRKTTDKLAPLFTKRRKPDPEVLAARRLFLQPDITDNPNKSTSRKVNVCGILPFPLVSHVAQLNGSSCDETGTFNIPKEVCDDYHPFVNATSFKHLVDLSKRQPEALEKIKKPKIRDALTDIEKYCSSAREMWDVISLMVKQRPNNKAAASPKTRTKRGKQSERKEKSEEKDKDDQSECYSWTYKYRPKGSQEVVGNEEAVGKLREWILGWKATFTNEDCSSGDEFYSSDSNHSRITENNQVAVLLGPHGCGKTASVYAIAEEYGYTVLELNASSRRTGKKILKELEEATKSHRIKKDEKTSTFSSLASEEIVPKKIPQNSLILIEDVDIVFEEDEGFISATYQLASNSKRPIVMTSRDVCPHLNKMAPQQNRIYFQDAASNRVPALLELISLAETGHRLPSYYVTELLQTGDLRKAILQLQYLLISGPPRTLDQTINFKSSFWQNVQYSVYKPAIKVNKKLKRRKATNNESTSDNGHILANVASKLDNIALISSLIDVQDSALNLWQTKTQPSLSLIENTASYSACSDTCLNIGEWIGSRIIHKDELNEREGLLKWDQSNVMLRKQLNTGVSFVLSQTTPLLLDRHTSATDYQPSLRAICRAEESRANANSKRGNRFFHYLHNLKAPSTLKPNILTAACKIMYDKVDDSTNTGQNDLVQ